MQEAPLLPPCESKVANNDKGFWINVTQGRLLPPMDTITIHTDHVIMENIWDMSEPTLII